MDAATDAHKLSFVACGWLQLAAGLCLGNWDQCCFCQ